MNEWAGMTSAFLIVTGLAFLILRRVLRRPQPGPDEAAPGQSEETEPQLILGGWTEALGNQLPATRGGTEQLQQAMRNAGFYRPTALMEYRAVRALLTVLPLVATGVLALLVDSAHVLEVLIGGAIVAGLGFSLPRTYLALRARLRNRQIERGLPVALDLMTLCLSAGQTIQAALEQAATELRLSHPALAEELAITEQHARLSSLEHALQQWADRLQVPEARNVALLLMQSERLGTDTAATLLEYANSLRTNLRQRAEARANRASFWMLIPSVFCLWIAAAIILIGPVYLEFWRYRRESVNLLQKGKNNVEKSNSRPRPNPAPEPGAARAEHPGP
jgi:tight adherence protein C